REDDEDECGVSGFPSWCPNHFLTAQLLFDRPVETPKRGGAVRISDGVDRGEVMQVLGAGGVGAGGMGGGRISTDLYKYHLPRCGGQRDC
ncbi:MAG: hypothetical protein ACI82F_000611, partial [Planctomycetota bacterium]